MLRRADIHALFQNLFLIKRQDSTRVLSQEQHVFSGPQYPGGLLLIIAAELSEPDGQDKYFLSAGRKFLCFRKCSQALLFRSRTPERHRSIDQHCFPSGIGTGVPYRYADTQLSGFCRKPGLPCLKMRIA